ncbi:hypothetical protein LX36DRAFT_669209 [Colletotrichum falcatum]|nr:hypothetical protein LX36DRAFT_669209 [Colletotrichum falcatum]
MDLNRGCSLPRGPINPQPPSSSFSVSSISSFTTHPFTTISATLVQAPAVASKSFSFLSPKAAPPLPSTSMRRRNSAKSGSTLTRSKSTASFRSAVQRLEHIDPAIAERDAHIAATLSFCRSGLASDPEIRPWLSRNHSISGYMESWPEDPAGDDRSQHGLGENGLRRQQSVRFIGQGSRSKRPQIQETDASSEADTIRRRNVLKDVGNRPQTQASGKVGRSSVSTYTTNYVDSLPSVDSFRPPDECAPPPASYRKLRKSRSMFAPSNPTTQAARYYSNNSPKQLNRQAALQPQFMQDMKENRSPTEPVGLRAPKSTSFLTLRGTASVARTSSRQQNDLAVQDAEETFRRNIEDQRKLRKRSSIFFPRTKKSQNSLGLRKSMREFGSEVHLADAPNSLTASKDASLRKRARKVSNSLKSRLKEIFGLSKKEKLSTVAIKNEAVNVVGNEDGIESEQDDPYMDIIDPAPTDECSISQVPSRVPSLHDASSSRRLRSRQGSIESIGSERKVSNERSCVTSWTSSGTHTLDSQRHRSNQPPKLTSEEGIKEVEKQKPSTIRCVVQDDDVFQDSWWEQASGTAFGIDAHNSVTNEATSSSGSALHHRQRSESEASLASQKESNQASIEPHSPTASSLNLELIPMRRHPSLSEEDPRLTYSESIYSDELRSSLTTPRLNISNTSSVEWKTWLSANASTTDANLANARAHALTEVRYSKPSMPRSFGHVREGAEIEDSPSPMSYKPTCSKSNRLQTPLRSMSHNPRQASSASRVELGTKTPVFMTPTRDENAAPRLDGRVTKHLRGAHGPPTIPQRSSLRATPSMPLMRSRASRNNIPIKFAIKEASKMRSFDTMPKLRSAEVSPRPNSRSPATTFRHNGADSEMRSSASSPGLTKAFEKQFVSLVAKENPKDPMRGSPSRKEGSMRRPPLGDSSDHGIADRPNATSHQDMKPQTGGGNQMLEDFWSSRRQVSIGNESAAFL